MDELSRRRTVRRPDNGIKGSGLTPLTVKLMICSAIFAIAVVVRFAYGTESVRTAVVDGIAKDAGYAAVFSDIGRALTDGESVKSFFEDGTLPVFGVQQTDGSDRTGENGQEGDTSDNTADAGEGSGGNTQETNQQTGDQQQDIVPAQESAEPVDEAVPTALPDGSELKFEMLALTQSGEEDEDDTPPTLFQISPPDNVSLLKPQLGFQCTVPLKGRITSGFGYRDHPLDDDTKFHFGIDIAASSGAAIVAFADGKVTKRAYNSINGYYMYVEHKNGFISVYCHCSRLKAALGSTVKRGQTIALVGSTGAATGPHLHFEVRCNGKTLNPTLYINPEAA